MIISPFMELDDERRKRDQAMMQSLGNFGSSLASVPLTYQNLLNEQQDRARKIDKDKQELLSKKDQERRETESHNQNMETGAFNLQHNKDEAAGKDKKQLIHNFVASSLADKPDSSVNEVMEKAFADPSLSELGNSDDVKAEIASQLEAKRKTTFGEGVKQQDADTRKKLADAKARRMAAAKLPKPPPKIALKYADELADADIKYQQIVGLQKYKEQGNIDSGPLSGAIQWLRQMSHTQNPQEAVLNAEFKTLLNKELHELSGATVTDNEYKRLSQMLPSQFDDEDVWEAIAQISKEAFEREYNTKLSTFQKVGYDTGGLTPLGEPKKSETSQGSASDITHQVMDSNPNWTLEQVKAEVKARMKRK